LEGFGSSAKPFTRWLNIASILVFMDSPSNLFVSVNFMIIAETEFGDTVSLTGNVPELGRVAPKFRFVDIHAKNFSGLVPISILYAMVFNQVLLRQHTPIYYKDIKL
jgi:hypothetical protein